MPVYRFRDIGEMPRIWRDPHDPGNLRAVAEMMTLHRLLSGPERRRKPGVTRYRSIEEMKADRQA